MNIRNEIAQKFRRAVDDAENLINGEINWDFVEADIMIDIGIDRCIEEMGSMSSFFDYFSELVDLQLALEAA